MNVGETDPTKFYKGHKSMCKTCHNARGQQWAENNREKSRAIKRKYVENNPEKNRASKLKYQKNNLLSLRENMRKKRREDPEAYKEKNSQYYENNKDRIIPYVEEWRRKNRDKVTHYLKTYNLKHPEKATARIKVRQAIFNGKLIPLPCEKCNELKTEAHHTDYSKPLDVMWLCGPCHREEHKRLRREDRWLANL